MVADTFFSRGEKFINISVKKTIQHIGIRYLMLANSNIYLIQKYFDKVEVFAGPKGRRRHRSWMVRMS